MKRVMTIATASVAAVLLTLAISVSAQDFNTSERTFLTFSAPVELPGVTLQPGTYVFRLADVPTRNVIQVLTKDEMDVVGHWLFVPAQRRDVTGETVVTFKETKEGTTPAVQYWYYPGESIGKEFIYPKDQAQRIAARTGATVKTEEGEVTASASVVDGAGLPAEKTSPEANVAVSEAAPAAADVSLQAQATEPAAPAAPVGTSGSQTAAPTDNSAPQTTAAAELPSTASPLPLAGLLGFFSLASAAGLRRLRRQ